MAGRVALVVFTGQCELPYLRVLKPGFRHCFVLVADGPGWQLYDPLSHATILTVLPGLPDFDAFSWLLDQGCVVVPVRVRQPPRRPAPAGLFTCVEAVKRVLGIHARAVVTPWRLFRFLLENGIDKSRK